MNIGPTQAGLALLLTFLGAAALGETRDEKILFVEPALRLLTQCDLRQIGPNELTCSFDGLPRKVAFPPGVAVWKGRDWQGVDALRLGDRLDIKLGLDARSREVATFIWANFVRVEGVVGYWAARNWVRIHPLVPFSIGAVADKPIFARVDGGTSFLGGARAEDLRQGRPVIVIGERLGGGRVRATRIVLAPK